MPLTLFWWLFASNQSEKIASQPGPARNPPTNVMRL